MISHAFAALVKVIYPNYYKYLAYVLAHEMGFVVQQNVKSLLDVQASLPETSPFFVCPNVCSEQLFLSVVSTWDV